METPGITAFCASVTVPESVALDWARTGGAMRSARTRQTARDRSRCIEHPPYLQVEQRFYDRPCIEIRPLSADVNRQERLVALSNRLFCPGSKKPGAGLERNVSVLLGRVLVAFVLEVLQGSDQLAARLARANDLVHESPRGCRIRIREFFPELADFLRPHGGRVGCGIELTLVQDIDGALRAHHGNFRRRPRVVEVGPNVFARH